MVWLTQSKSSLSLFDALNRTGFKALFLSLLMEQQHGLFSITHRKIARHAASRRRSGKGSPGWSLIILSSKSKAKWQLCLLHLKDLKGRLTVDSLKSPKHIFCGGSSSLSGEKLGNAALSPSRRSSSGVMWASLKTTRLNSGNQATL